jgi:hypothetical protein
VLKMSVENKFVIGTRRRAQRTVRRKVTVDVTPEDEALLRVTARDWGQPLGAMVGIALRCFVGSGWADRGELTVGEDGMQRIRGAVARWEATRDQPVLDPSIYAGAVAGDDAGAEAGTARSEWNAAQASCDRG